MAVATVAAGDPVASEDHNVLAGLFNGTTGYGQPAKFYELNDATAYSVIAGNQDTTNGYAFKAQYGTLSGTPTTLVTIAKGGVALMPSSTELGMKVQSTGRIGVFDSVSVDLLAATTPFSMTRTNALGEVMADFQLRSTMPGTQVTTGTAASGTNTTLTVAGTPWTVNAYAGKIVHLLTGTGASAADPYRYVVSNTNNTLTIDSDVVWTTNPGAGTTFEILTPGDIGAARFLTEAKSGSVAARRAIEAHAFAQTGAADSGTTAIEVSFVSNAAQFDPNNNVGISIAASAAWLTGNVGVEQGTHLRLWGGLGSARYVACENASGTLEASIYKGGLGNFGDATFDTVIMTQALQAVEHPDELLDDMLRVAREAIITFPNFAHWKTRGYLFWRGMMPVSEALPYSWYDTPNIHLCTFRDFEALCAEKGVTILSRRAVDGDQQGSVLMKRFPNLLGEVAIYRITR